MARLAFQPQMLPAADPIADQSARSARPASMTGGPFAVTASTADGASSAAASRALCGQLSGAATVAGAVSGAPPIETGPMVFDCRSIRLRIAGDSP